MPPDDTTLVAEVIVPSNPVLHNSNEISFERYAPVGFSHQSAAAFGDYVVLVTDGRMKIYLYNLAKKEVVCTLGLRGLNKNIYHCNQSTFGAQRYDDSDYFPLLYISQRAKDDGRCFVEVYRIIPHYDEMIQEFGSFNVELVQIIYLPRMTNDNSLGNANCVIDSDNAMMYTYSRNNNSSADNYGQCKISQFAIPNVYRKIVSLEDKDILSSFMIDTSALYMQGGCIKNGLLYIGQGDPALGYVYLNVVDLIRKELVQRYDLQALGFKWEPEGCFFYDGSVMLTYAQAISRMLL